MTFFLWYVVIRNGEKVWAQRKSSANYRPRQHHYFHCPYTSSSRGGTSLIHSLKTRHVSVLPRLKRQRRRSMKNIHSSTTQRVSRLNISLSINFIFYMFYDNFLLFVRTYCIHYLFDIIF